MLCASVACVMGLCARPAEAIDYYVSTSGSNSNSGKSLASPFRTIQQAAVVARAGDNIYVRGGTYRETVTVIRSGTSSAPITFQPYASEQVTITGLDVAAGAWSPYNGSTYSTTVSSGVSQVFVGGQMMTEARWPNAGSNNPLHAATSTVGSATYQAPPANSTITDAALAGTPNNTWNNAKMSVLPVLEYVSRNAVITNQTGNTLGFQWTVPGGTYWFPVAGNPYYLYGSLAALNAPREWHYDAPTSKLYLQAPGGANPGSQTVEVRKRQLGFDLGSQSYVNISGFALKAASINVAGNHNLIDNVQILYPTPFGDPNGYAGQDGVVLSGQYNTISNSEIGFSWGDGVTLKGPNNTVTNNLIHDVNWSATASAGVNAVYAGSNSTISNNTIYNAGRDGILLGLATNTPNTTVLHNDVSRFGFLAQDLGGIYTWNADNAGSVIAYNRIHDSRGLGIKAGIYLDDYVNGVTAHHNLVYDTTRGMYVKGSNNNAYNNTLWNVPDGAVVPSYADPPTTTQVRNNLSNNSTFGGATVSNNRYQTVDQFTNSATGDYTLTANNGLSFQTGPTFKKAVDYGTVISGITDGYTGSAPDAGAFEMGNAPWTAGASFRTWLFANQVAAPLSAALYVTQSGQRITTGPLTVGNVSSTSNNNRAFVKFDLSGIATAIESATLRIYEGNTPTSSSGDVTLGRVSSAWTSENVTFNQAVDAATQISGFYDPANLDFYTNIDVTSMVRGWLSNPSTNFGFSLSGMEGSTGTAKFFDGFYGVTAPQLVITLATAGDYNQDHVVDAADYVLWRKLNGVAGSSLPNDSDLQTPPLGSPVGPGHFDLWRKHFGEQQSGVGYSPAAQFAIPEPNTLALAMLAMASISMSRRAVPRLWRQPIKALLHDTMRQCRLPRLRTCSSSGRR